jgi:hypothetical protein
MRVAKMGYAQRVTRRDKKGRVTSSFERVRVVVPDGLPASLPPPYTGQMTSLTIVQKSPIPIGLWLLGVWHRPPQW